MAAWNSLPDDFLTLTTLCDPNVIPYGETLEFRKEFCQDQNIVLCITGK